MFRIRISSGGRPVRAPNGEVDSKR